MTAFLTALIHFDVTAMVQTGGYVGIALIIFAESGILVGIFLPGDSLLFVSGLLAATGLFSLPLLIAIVIVAAVLGDSFGYWLGAKAGRALFDRPDSRWFKRAHLERTEQFYARYGGRAVVLSRFVPIVRTIAPMLAGTGHMSYRRFLRYNLIGGMLWGAGMLTLGWSLGSIFPASGHYILPLSLAVILISFLPFFVKLVRTRRERAAVGSASAEVNEVSS